MPPKKNKQPLEVTKVVYRPRRTPTSKLPKKFHFPQIRKIRKITKDNPIQPPELHEWTTSGEMGKFLRMLVFSNGTQRDDWHLHLSPIGFTDSTAKANWTSFGDVEGFTTFSQWFRNVQSPLPWTTRIALFCTWTDSWVKLPDHIWKFKPWHAWVAILRPVTNVGFDLILWDPDHESIYQEDILTRVDDPQIRLQDLMGMQQNLIAFLRKENYSLRNVWIGGNRNDDEEGRCMYLCGEFIRKLTTNGWMMPLPWTNEGLKAGGFRWVRMDKRKDSSTSPVPAKESDKIDGWDAELPRHLTHFNENGELVPIAGGRRSREHSSEKIGESKSSEPINSTRYQFIFLCQHKTEADILPTIQT